MCFRLVLAFPARQSCLMTNTRRKFLASSVGAGALLGAPQHPSGSPAVPRDALDSEKFRAAVLQGDLQTVIEYLDRDPALLYSRDVRGTSVYTLACLTGQKRVAQAFEARGLILDIFEAAVSGNVRRATEICNVTPGIIHVRSAGGQTPLHYAASAGQVAMVNFLNAQGADLSAGPESPLLTVAEYPDSAVAEAMARTLAGNGSDPNAKRKDGATALQLAIARGNIEVAHLLIHRGASSDDTSIERVYFGGRYSQDLHGKPVVRDDTCGLPQAFINQFVTVAHFDPEKVKQMYKLCPSLLATRATWDELAIEAAAHMGLVPLAEYLADLGSPVSTCTAAVLGLTRMVADLVHADCDRLRERGAHDIPLLAYTAFGKERVDVAEFLLRSGAGVDIRAFGQTTLHLAAGKGHLELARILLEHGADVNAAAKSSNGPLTPLAIALRQKQASMAEFLKERGGRM
ncbi:MAG: hypothetical protein DMG59_21905 [Acidobacteria bacterium]|nr:MAG: hypothetical protein DMG59_21905 [Acidobacteriota bacterium]